MDTRFATVFKGPRLPRALLLGGLAGACSDDARPRETYTREQLLDPQTCQGCHLKHYDEWSGSMHAYASIDPVFRAMNARGQRETNGALGEFCVNCHAPMAVREHATTDGTDLDSVPKALQGVTCYFCHQVTGVTASHNNPLVLANDTTMRGEFGDPVENPAHLGVYSVLHDSARVETATDMDNGSKLCGACHDVSVPGHFSSATDGGVAVDVPLEQTFFEWQESLFSKPIRQNPTPESCNACHSNKSEDVIANGKGLPVGIRRYRHSHDFPGVDVALTDFPNRDEQRDRVLGLLKQALAVQLCVGTKLSGNATVLLDNSSAGHYVPSGASQDRRFWLELHASDNLDRELYGSGAVLPGRSVTELEGKTAVELPGAALGLDFVRPALVELRDVALDKNGNPAHMFWDIARIDRSMYSRSPIPAALSQLDPNHARTYTYVNPHPDRLPARVRVTLHVQPIGADVLDDLVASGDLPPADAAENIIQAMPTFDVIPNPGDGGVTSTLEWTPALAASGPTQAGFDGDDMTCVSTVDQQRLVLPSDDH